MLQHDFEVVAYMERELDDRLIYYIFSYIFIPGVC